MDFASIVFFLGLYYIRPQEWMSWVAVIQPVKLVMVVAIASMVMKYRREGSFLGNLFRTPHDWMMLVYFFWLVGTAPDVRGTFSNVYSHLLFYLVTVQALSRIERIQSYLNWWTIFILAIAALAVASEYGFDPVNSGHDLTHGRMQGRLVLNTSIFNNPNALGHSIIPSVVMLYFICFWNRPVFLKTATIFLLLLPLWCIYLTGSKGAFISGFATVVTALVFRRPKTVQILIFLLAFTAGWGALQMLPRMQDMENAKGEGGIQGRLAAFQFGLDTLKTKNTGVGYGNFVRSFESRNHYPKAPHSSYVQVGAELGYVGLTLFLGILYCCVRTLLTAKTVDVPQERVRRILFVLLISFLVSSWMVGWSYRATFFLMVACIAAFHRILLASARPIEEQETSKAKIIKTPSVTITGLDQAPPASSSSENISMPDPVKPTALTPEIAAIATGASMRWNRLGWIDIVAMIVLTVLTVKFWQIVMHHI